MAELKTQRNSASVSNFINSVESEQKREDSLKLLQLFEEVTGLKASMWGDSIIGFGSYHYKSDRSTQEGDWPLTGFSPRKSNISIYIMPGFGAYEDQLSKLGKHKVSKGSCLYINKLADIDTKVLSTLIKDSVAEMRKRYDTSA